MKGKTGGKSRKNELEEAALRVEDSLSPKILKVVQEELKQFYVQNIHHRLLASLRSEILNALQEEVSKLQKKVEKQDGEVKRLCDRLWPRKIKLTSWSNTAEGTVC